MRDGLVSSSRVCATMSIRTVPFLSRANFQLRITQLDESDSIFFAISPVALQLSHDMIVTARVPNPASLQRFL